MATILSGKAVAEALHQRLAQQMQTLAAAGVTPTLAILRVGERPDDLAYERGAAKRCEKLGVAVRRVTLAADCAQEELMSAVRAVNENAGIHGCLLLRPLPAGLDERAACEALRPEKDVDCVTGASLARVFTGRGAGYPPCTAQACLEILDHYGCVLDGQRVTDTMDLAAECRRADVLIAAAGKAGAIGPECVSRGQIIIDVGIHVTEDGGMCGDVDYPAVEPLAGAITPVPGGVGAVTSTVLAGHVIRAAADAAGIAL